VRSSPSASTRETVLVADSGVLVERLLRVIDEGRRTATYKLALVTGLLDAIAELPGDPEIPTRLIAERVVDLYYPQTREYIDTAGGTRAIRQITMKSSPAIAAVAQFRSSIQPCAPSVTAARTANPTGWKRAVDEVESTFVRYPIPLMQVVGTQLVPFLYDVDWAEGTAVSSLRRTVRDRVRLLDGVSERLVTLGPMLRPLIELHWVRDVARWSGIATEDEHLHRHMFGDERVAWPKGLVGNLAELQGGECSYCGARLGARQEIDHFLAWSRWPNDAVENLVVADRCNGAKSNHIAATTHLTRWRLRNEVRQRELTDLASVNRWESSPSRTWALVRSVYGYLPTGTPLWVRDKTFELLDEPLNHLITIG
jgi:hypothetical protein